MPEEIQNEAGQEPQEPVDAETREILEGLRKDGHEVEIPGEVVEKKDEPAAPEKTEEKKAEAEPEKVEPKPEDQPDKKEDDGKASKEPKEPRYIPTWQHKIAEKNWEKEKSGLLDKIATLQTNPSGTQSQEQKEALGDIQSTIDKLVEERGYDEGVKDLIADVVKIVKAATPSGSLTAEQLEALNTFKSEAALLQTERLQAHQEKSFNEEFEEKVLPAIEREYPGIPKETLNEIKLEVKSKAFSEEYAKTDLAVIYKGMDEFRGRYTAPRKGPEDARGGQGRDDGSIIDFDNVTEEQFSKFTDEQKDAYFARTNSKK